MEFQEIVTEVKKTVTYQFKNYVLVEGRAARSEFWYWALFCFLVTVVTGFVDRILFGSVFMHPLTTLFRLATLLPSVSVGVRRLHDVNRSGWWLLISLTIIGAFFPLLYWDCTEGTKGDNRYGKDPLAK